MPLVKTFFKEDMTTRAEARAKDEADEASRKRKWDAEIDLRDGKKCRACGKASNPDVVGLTSRGHRAHIVYASAGGTNEPSNRVTLCWKCHTDEHKNRLRFSEDGTTAGIDANKPMEFWRKLAPDAGWYLSARETSVGHFERD